MHGSMPKPKPNRRRKRPSLGRRIGRSAFVMRLAAWAIGCYIGFVRLTSRFEEDGPGLSRLLESWNGGAPMIMAFWHGRLLMMARFRKGPSLRRIHVLISNHADGEIIARSIEGLGMSTVRGSSRKGGFAAMRELHQVIESGGHAAFTPDGPSGPCMRAKGGTIAAASMGGIPVFPVTFSARRGPVLNSWDRFLLATPFNRGLYLVGEPFTVPADLDEAAFEQWRCRLEDDLNALTHEADRRMGRPRVEPPPPKVRGARR